MPERVKKKSDYLFMINYLFSNTFCVLALDLLTEQKPKHNI